MTRQRDEVVRFKDLGKDNLIIVSRNIDGEICYSMEYHHRSGEVLEFDKDWLVPLRSLEMVFDMVNSKRQFNHHLHKFWEQYGSSRCQEKYGLDPATGDFVTDYPQPAVHGRPIFKELGGSRR